MKLTRIALALAVAAATGSSHAADLVTVYRDALVSDPVYQAARAQYQANRERLPQARSQYLPQIFGSASWFRNDINREIASDFTYNTTSWAFTLSQPVFRLQNWIAISQADKQVLQAEAILGSAAQELIVRVAQAYFEVLLAQDNVALSESQKTAISEQLNQAKRNFEVGTATIVDTLEAQARYDQSVAKEIFDKNDLDVKRRALQQLLGKLPEGLVPLKEPLPLILPQPNNIEEWVRASKESSFSVLVARIGYEIAEEEVRRQRAGHLPTLDITANYGHNYNPASSSPGLVGANTNAGSVGLTLSMPIYQGGLVQSRVREALALRDRTQQDLENTERTVAQAVSTAFLNVSAGIAQVRALEQAQVSTQSQLDSTVLGRDVGVRTSVDVLNAQQQVTQTRRDLQQARYAYLMNSLRLKAATGTLNEADVEQVNRALGR